MRMRSAFFQKFRLESADYFKNYTADVSRNNMFLLRKASAIYTLLLLMYAVWAYFSFHAQLLTWIYGMFILLAVGFAMVVFRGAGKLKKSLKTGQALCVLFIIMVMGFITVVSVFPFPERPAIFFPILYLLMTLVFVFPIWKIQLLLTAIEAVYLLLSFFYKTKAAFAYDASGSITAWLLGFLFSYLVLELRLREHQTRKKLEVMSITDETTGLFNRRYFNRYLSNIYLVCKREEIPIAVFMIDIDDFKRYNDRFGHIKGDECLYRVANAIRGVFRDEEALAARFGGEEFVCCMMGKVAKSAEKHAEEILKSVRGLSREAAHGLKDAVTVSIGVAVEENPCKENYLSLLQNSDTALYRAKSAGKNRAVLYRPQIKPE